MIKLLSVILVVMAGFIFATDLPMQPRAEIGFQDGVPMFLNYQGYLTDPTGNPINANVSMGIGIYDSENGGNLLKQWILNPVSVQQGIFNLKLQLAEADTTIFRLGLRRWFQLTVNSQVLLPRTEITSMPYSIQSARADNADMLDGRHAHQFIYNQNNLQGSANFYISGNGWAQGQFAAYASGVTGSAALYGQSNSNSNAGVFGRVQGDSNFGVRGHNSHLKGTAIGGSGNNDPLVYLTSGSGGTFSAKDFGLFGYASSATGTGVASMGNGIQDTVYTLASGCGGAFNGSTIGVYGLARNLTGNRGGGYFRTYGTGTDTVYAYIAYHHAGTRYGILSDGNKSTIMNTRAGKRVLFAPESPQPYFEDFGSARLVNGHCRVNLDPLFLDCVAVTQDRPLLVFVTLADECNGVYVKTDATGFDVYELQNGKSSAGFFYRVIGLRKGDEHLRFPVAPEAPADLAVPAVKATQPSAPPVR